ncbi:iron-siderophore ABC transporter substrate-binding protein [Calothrix sp. FACHB-1219]|uniref:iron-siderophore ABC transporter substrate-binding protein n=1 Tax=unclassified Calothrix TaxID=2619626 RepID=UPI0016822EF8|nr:MULTISPECIES: iron-siderophore ABC transporter substrate-binding protein [unclassified Calothrix]MBD2207887.1 iron-siderophore ABC transporter substrate-binding protein [Calothrix sp. FACHB-168]MBD2222469.1 iron-siderophore ABC transporter substrate-binding protein [Calothrix sp. FACHB-1219]
MKKVFYYIKIYLLIIISCFITIACHSNLYSKVNNLPDTTSLKSQCRLIKHELGESCIPLNPQRILVTDQVALEAVIALGFKPVGAPDTAYVASKSSFLKEKMAGITYIGKEHQFNLETILNLHPDVIISLYGINSTNYELFSRIAPTVQFKYVHAKWQESWRQIGEVLGKREQAEKLLADYKQRLTQLRTVLNQQINKLEVSISRFHGQVQLPEFRSQFSFPGSILQEVGISMPEAQRQLIKTPDDTLIILNLERIDLLDADVLFVAVDPGARDLFQKYQNTRLWQTLNVVQKQQVYSVDSSYWIFGSILSANAIVDDLFKYLLKAT